MTSFPRLISTRHQTDKSGATGSTEHVQGDDQPGIIGALGLSMLAMSTSALISGLVVLAICRLGANSGIPVLGFRGALALSLLVSWFSIGATAESRSEGGEFQKFLIRTIAHQISSALLMLLLVGVLSLLLVWGPE